MIAWSKWDGDNYEPFQKKLMDKIKNKTNEYPLDWEGKTWIEIAKSRKKG